MTPFEVSSPLPITPAQARTISDLAHRASGVKVSPEKLDFLRTRLTRRLREIGCGGFQDYLSLLEGASGATEMPHMVEALTTHTTSFFREKAHYDWLEEAGLPALVEAGTGVHTALTVWSAACSIGAEMWTAAIVLDRFAARRGMTLRYDLVGTDISRKILRRAAGATFTEAEISGLPENLRKQYLLRAQPGGPKGPEFFRMVPALRSKAKFIHANLLELGQASAFTADVVFLRNVLIYFTPQDQANVVAGVLQRIRPGGYLLTGHTESLPNATEGLRQLGASIYQRI